ncbi:AbiH family protein [Sphingobacterium haloxyli]|uniref:Uncharacterized protein n=1 Tax=Sphingobacterium haloxyli TaxID=2100533 RepID=A0A2S9J700_9SPHI|nr:AbiH family protein [Sphingobacterium haloxyli]PRD48530.1 hypothetical protein C5745_04835 [Sphingobacterium haloxyli]
MINALHILQEAVNHYKQWFAAESAESAESLQLALQHACEQTLTEINNLYRQYTEHQLAEHAVQHCHRLLTNMHNTLHEERPADSMLLELLAAMIEQYELSYESYLLHTSTLSRYAEKELREAVLLRLKNVLPSLRKKNIPAVYLAELSSAINSLFTAGKLPELKFSHRHYLSVFLTALEEMAADSRKKDWATRFLHILINYNFNHMGFFNRWKELQAKLLSEKHSHQDHIRLLRQQEDDLRLHIPVPTYSYDPLRPSLASYMSEHVRATIVSIQTAIEENPLLDEEVLLSTLSADEMCVIFHATYHANLFPHSTKREAAKSFATNIRSKTGRKISYKTLVKFDRPALEPAANSSRKKVKLMLHFIEREFNTIGMPKILITGNGFDLSFGLPTAYSDFINICKKLQTCSEFNWEDLKEDILALQNSNIVPSSSFDDFEGFKTCLSESTWFKYLSREYTINTWIDFEKHIEKALEAILIHLDQIRTETFIESGRYSKNKNIYYKSGFDQKKYEAYLTLIDFKIFMVKEGFKPQLNPHYLKSVNEYYVDFERDKLFTAILEDLDDFRNIFSEYLNHIVTPLYEILNNDDRSILLKNITHHFTFNYTPTFNKLVSHTPLTSFIHGELGGDNNIVLGINDWENIGDDGSNLIPFTKYFQKLNFGIDLKFINEVQSRDSLYQFFFWGHSLDKSDSLYINEIFDRVGNLEKGRAEGRIIVIYHSKSSKFNIIKNLIEIRGSEDVLYKQRKGQLTFTHCNSEKLEKELNFVIRSRTASDGVNIY